MLPMELGQINYFMMKRNIFTILDGEINLDRSQKVKTLS